MSKKSSSCLCFSLVFVLVCLPLFWVWAGGLILVPLLPVFLPLSPLETLSTSLFVVLLTVFINSLAFIRKSLVNKPCFFYMALGAVSVAVLMSHISLKGADIVFRMGLVFALLMILLNPLSLLKLKPKSKALRAKPPGVKAFLLGGCGGFLTGVSGVGGSIFSPLLFQLGWLEDKKIVPTVNAVMFVTVAGTLLSLCLGQEQGFEPVKIEPAGALLAGSFLSSFAGRLFNIGPYEKLRQVLLKILVFCLLIKVALELPPYVTLK